MRIFPTPSEGVERWDENVGKWLTFGRWVEGKVYGADESVRLGCPKTDRCPISDTF